MIVSTHLETVCGIQAAGADCVHAARRLSAVCWSDIDASLRLSSGHSTKTFLIRRLLLDILELFGCGEVAALALLALSAAIGIVDYDILCRCLHESHGINVISWFWS